MDFAFTLIEFTFVVAGVGMLFLLGLAILMLMICGALAD